MATQPTDWTNYDDFGELLGAAYNEVPGPGAHGLLVEDDFSSGSWAWAWFATPEERLGWIIRIKQLEPDSEPLSAADVGVLREIGAGPSTGPGLEINGATVEWMGRVEDLLQGDDEVVRKWRARFWERLEPSDVEYEIPSDPDGPIPAEARADFLESIYPT